MKSLNRIVSLLTILLVPTFITSTPSLSSDTVDPHWKVGKTLGLVMTQEFFDNLQFNLVEKLLNSANLTLLNQTSIDLDLGIMEIASNITNVTIVNATLAEQDRLITLYDDYMTVNVNNMNLHLDMDYEYISNPAILVDIGLVDIKIQDFKVFLNVTSNYSDYDLSLQFSNFSLGLGGFDVQIDGLSDLSLIVNNLLHKVFWLLGVKVTELTTTNLQKKFVPLANRFADSISDTVPVGSTGLHLDIAFASNIICKNNSYLQLPLSLSLQSDDYPYTNQNNATFPDYSKSEYQLEAYITEYLVNNFLYELHYAKLINISTGELDQITVGLMQWTGPKFEGYNTSSPCEFVVTTVDKYPEMNIGVNSSNIQANASIEVKCKKQPNDTEFVHSLNMYFWLNMDFNLTINETNNKLEIFSTNLVLNYEGFDQSTVGDISSFRMNLYMAVIQAGARAAINILFQNGIDINYIIKNVLGINFIYFEKLNLVNLEDLIQFRMIPVFNITSTTPQELIDSFNQQQKIHHLDLSNLQDASNTQHGGFEDYMAGKINSIFEDREDRYEFE